MWCTAQRKDRPKLRSYFSPLVDQNLGPKNMIFWRDFGRLRTSIANISGMEKDIDNRKTALQTTISPASADIIPQILDLVFKIAPISDHVAKFRGDRPRDRGDLTLDKKEKKETAAKHKSSRVALRPKSITPVSP